MKENYLHVNETLLQRLSAVFSVVFGPELRIDLYLNLAKFNK